MELQGPPQLPDISLHPTPSRTRRPFLIAGVIVMLVLFGGFGYVWYRSTHPPAHPPKVMNPQAALNQGNLGGALGQIDQVLAKDPNNVEALIQKSFALSQQGSLTFNEAALGGQAAVVAEQAIGLAASSSEAYRALGYANEIQQKYTEAHAAYQKAIALNSKNAQAVYDDAHAYDLQGNAAKAEAGYKAALALDPTLYAAYLGIGRAENASGNASASMDAFKQVYNSDPNQHDKSEASYSIGMLLLATGTAQVNLARGYFEQAISFDSTYPSAYLGEGTALYIQATAPPSPSLSTDTRTQLMIASTGALQKAIQLNPNQSLAYMQLAADLLVLGQKDAASGALASAKLAVSHDITLSVSEKSATLARIADLSAQIKSSKLP